MADAVHSDVVIIGASAAGLAVAACLQREGVPSVKILEKADRIAVSWRSHYDRLHLHTARQHSALPGLPMPADYPKYPSRDQVVSYLENYASHFGLKPEFGQEVISVEQQNGHWLTRTRDKAFQSSKIVFATGYNRVPNMPEWPNRDHFGGEILHSSSYKNGQSFKGKKVLVIGFGNSGGEIAIDLHEHGAEPSIAVRSAVNIIPRDILGLPILSVGIFLSKFSSTTSDRLSAPLLNFIIGDLTRYGLRKLPYGPITQIRREHRVPLLDIGTVALIKKGAIKVRPGISQFLTDGVEFDDHTKEKFDAVVCATGYNPDLRSFFTNSDGVLDSAGAPVKSGVESERPGLYFCGYYISPNGMLREIGIEAQHISQDIRSKLG